MSVIDLIIDDIGAQGDGVSHVGHSTVFVAGALTGEKVRVDLEESSNLVKRAQLLEILIPSSWRVQPPCPHFPRCGGCRFQHMNDDSYSNFKLGQLQNLLLREKINLPTIIAPVITAPETRRRIRVAARHTAKGIIIGFNEWRSNELIDLSACPVALPVLIDLVQKLRSLLALWLPKGDTCDIQLTALPTGIDMILIGGPKLDLAHRQVLGELAAQLGVMHLSWKKWDRAPPEPIAHQGKLTVTFGKTTVDFPPGSFLQATIAGEQALCEFASAATKDGAKVLDLFCGLGTFGLNLPQAKHVHFADLDGPAIESLAKAVRGNARYQVSLRNLAGDPFMAMECEGYDVAIFDPPRGGAKAQTVQLAKSKVKTVVAISCDPQSFTRDAKILIEAGYVMDSLLPVDQFLWSTHLECAARFTRS